MSPNNLASKVAPHVIKYWSMAGFQTMVLERVKNNIRKEVDKYQAINKNISRSSETEMKKRKEYLSILAQLFDIACKDLDQMLVKDRLLAADDKDNRFMAKEGYTRKVEDLAFLEDQRGAESEKRPDLPWNRFQQTQTFLTIAVNLGQNRQDFDRQNQKGGWGGWRWCCPHSVIDIFLLTLPKYCQAQPNLIQLQLSWLG